MPLPPEIDRRIRQRFEQLLAEAEYLVEADEERRLRVAYLQEAVGDPFPREFFALQTNFVALLRLFNSRQIDLRQTIDRVETLHSDQVDYLYGRIKGFKDDYETGMLDSLVGMIEAEIVGDYLSQAAALLGEGKQGSHDHVPAAVLVGAILEDALRRLCQRQNPPVPIKTGKYYKKMNTMIDDLRKAGLYNELKAKHLRAWADIRNAAAHGQFNEFDRGDVEQMLAGAQQFLADYL